MSGCKLTRGRRADLLCAGFIGVIALAAMVRRAASSHDRSIVSLSAVPSEPLFGRDETLDSILATLGSSRLLTLIGAPGVGKTSLARRATERLREEGKVREVLVVDLAAASTFSDLCRLVGDALRIPLSVDHDDVAACHHLRAALAKRRRALLVLDNAEQLVEELAVATKIWLESARLRILVTSREALRIEGEVVHEIEALACPPEPPPRQSSPQEETLREALESPAVQLLLARAPSYRVRDSDALALGGIARLLDGLPLALELAASRLALMGASELYQRLGDDLDALGPARRGVPARRASLRAALDGSWALLNDVERHALRCCALFRGDFSIEAALRIADDGARSAGTLLDALHSLRDKSLMVRAADEGRYRLYSSVRQYAQGWGIDGDAALRIARHFVSVGQTLGVGLQTSAASDAFRRLAKEREHFLAACDALRANQDDEAALLRADLLLSIEPVFARLGPGGAHLPRVLEVLESRALDDERRARLQIARARVHRDRGEMSDCVRHLEIALELRRGSERGEVRSELGEALVAQGEFERARDQLEIALREAESCCDRRIERRVRAALGLSHMGQGRLDEAQEHYTRVLDLCGQLGDRYADAQARRDLGTLYLLRGQLHRAKAYYEEALRRSPGDDLRLEGVVRGNLAIIEQESGELDAALLDLKRAITCLRAVSDRPFEAQLLGYLGAVHHERGQLTMARDSYTRALEVLSEVRDIRQEGVFLAARAAATVAGGELDSARLGQAQNDLEMAARRTRTVGDAALEATVAVHTAQVSLAEGLARAANGDRSRLEEAMREVSRVLEIGRKHRDRSDDLRFAMRMLKRAIPVEQLEIAVGGTWFRAPSSSVVHLVSRPTLMRVLDTLAKWRVESPGTPLSVETILQHGWPGERVMLKAGENRVRVAITTLRNLGLRGVLVHRDSGHLLDECVPMSRVDEAQSD